MSDCCIHFQNYHTSPERGAAGRHTQSRKVIINSFQKQLAIVPNYCCPALWSTRHYTQKHTGIVVATTDIRCSTHGRQTCFVPSIRSVLVCVVADVQPHKQKGPCDARQKEPSATTIIWSTRSIANTSPTKSELCMHQSTPSRSSQSAQHSKLTLLSSFKINSHHSKSLSR